MDSRPLSQRYLEWMKDYLASDELEELCVDRAAQRHVERWLTAKEGLEQEAKYQLERK